LLRIRSSIFMLLSLPVNFKQSRVPTKPRRGRLK
jgi:hypothetical protein